jgi:hypothetical protein
MAFSISKFRGTALTKSGARANLFDVKLTGAAAGAFGVNTTEFSFACKAANIPAMAVTAIEVPYFGRVVKVPGNKTFDNWSVTIINDEGFKIRNGFEEWMAAMGTHISNVVSVGAGFDSSGKGDLFGAAEVKHYGKAGPSDILATYNFENIFPVSVGEIALDWSSNDAIEEFTVEFAYDYWTHAGVVTD